MRGEWEVLRGGLDRSGEVKGGSEGGGQIKITLKLHNQNYNKMNKFSVIIIRFRKGQRRWEGEW